MTTVSRRVWQCPGCGQKWQIPATAPDPRFCVNCQKSSTGIPPVIPVPVATTQFDIDSVQSSVRRVMMHVLICILVVILAVLFRSAISDSSEHPVDRDYQTLMTGVVTTIMLIPGFIAGVRRHPFVLPIYVISFFLGWTCVAWIGVMVWAVWPIPKRHTH